MFLGQFIHSIDKKGRLIVPSKFREAVRKSIDLMEGPGVFFVARGLEGCLFVFAPDKWKAFIRQLERQPLLKGKARDFMRLFLNGACQVECDKQGRITLPKNLLDYAGIDRDVIVMGVSDRFEIWDEKRWYAYEAEKQKFFEEIAESLVEQKDI